MATWIPQFYFHFTSVNVENDHSTRFLKSTSIKLSISTFVIFNVIVILTPIHLKKKRSFEKSCPNPPPFSYITDGHVPRDTQKANEKSSFFSADHNGISKIDQIESTKKKNDKPLCFKHSRRHIVTNNS